jgi:hypothetical protein
MHLANIQLKMPRNCSNSSYHRKFRIIPYLSDFRAWSMTSYVKNEFDNREYSQPKYFFTSASENFTSGLSAMDSLMGTLPHLVG